jgi:hypothetical protein
MKKINILMRELNNSKIEDDGREINIGVIVHICYENTENEKTKKDIDFVINSLNLDFGKNSDNFDNGRNIYKKTQFEGIYEDYVSRAGFTNINFYLKDTIYKNIGKVSNNDIISIDTIVKINGSKPIEPKSYLNLWIVDMANELLGYAQFPWDLSNKSITDGVVIAKNVFGSDPKYQQYNLNKTATHEIGHWLGLYHVFQDTISQGGAGNEGALIYDKNLDIGEQWKGDCVVDTPPQAYPTFGNPYDTPQKWVESRASDSDNKHHHMFMNFMDYTDDQCLFMFTADQIIKMRKMIHLYRSDIVKLSDDANISTTTTSTTTTSTTTTSTTTTSTTTTSTTTTTEAPSTTTTTEAPTTTTEPPTTATEPPTTATEPPTTTASMEFPKITTTPTFTTIFNGFEMNNFIGETGWILSPTNARIQSFSKANGSYSLETKNMGYGTIRYNLSRAKSVVMELLVKANNKDTKIMVSPPGFGSWYSAKLPMTFSYRFYKFNLPGPFNSIGNEHYGIRIGTFSSSNNRSYFDNLKIIYENI